MYHNGLTAKKYLLNSPDQAGAVLQTQEMAGNGEEEGDPRNRDELTV